MCDRNRVIVTAMALCLCCAGCSRFDPPTINIHFTHESAGWGHVSLKTFVVEMREGDVYEGFELLQIVDDSTTKMAFYDRYEFKDGGGPPREIRDSVYISYEDLRFSIEIQIDAESNWWLRIDTNYTVEGSRGGDKEPRVMETTKLEDFESWRIPHRRFYPDGSLQEEMIMSYNPENRREVEIVTRRWSEIGRLVFKLEGARPRPTGRLTQWYENGAKSEEGRLVEGKKDGTWKYWDELGQPRDSGEHEWYRATGRQIGSNLMCLPGESRMTYKDGQPKKVQTDTEFAEWDERGQMRLHIERENHRNHGQHKEWHFDGTLKTEGQWNEGYRSGVWTHYWPNGAKRKEERYIKGLKGGWFLSRPPNEPASLLTLYREDGTIRFSEARGGADTIQRLYYDDSGHPADRETYLRGKLILINGEKVMR